MVEEEFVAASPTPSDLKRKHGDLEPDAPEPPPTNANGADSVQREEEGFEEENGGAADLDKSDAKRPRLDENPDGLVLTENGFQEEKVEDTGLPSAENYTESADAQEPTDEAPDTETDKQPSSDDQSKEETQPTLVENTLSEIPQQQPSGGEEHQEPSAEVPQAAVFYPEEQEPAAETETVSRKMEVPNNKVGVLIGKQGETIRFLQINSGAKIQITRDAEADPNSTTRPAELIGTIENITKAERLIKDVIAEADAGGSPSLVARGFSNVQTVGAAEQILIQVPNEKVGLIIGKSGETIKNLQTRSGARIQLTPQHLPDGDQSKERTVRVSGDKKQIEMAREMIKEVMDQTVRSSSLSGGYNQHQQQGFRPRGSAQPQWGHHRGPHPSQSGGFNYQHRGSYPPSQNSQYAPPPNYPPHQMGSSRSGSFGSGWEQRHPPSTMLQHGPGGGGGYDYYGGHMADVPVPTHGHGPSPTPMGHPPPAQGNYNYNYGQPQPAAPPYSSQPPQSYGHGHGYNEAKFDNQAPYHPSYGGGGSQPGPVGAGYPQQGYATQDQQYGKAPLSYTQQHYGGLPRGTQPGDNIPYQTGPMTVQPTPQQYPQNAAPPPQSQLTYPQTYPQPYTSDGYNINQQQQLQPGATGSAAPVYPQQGPVPGYGQQQQQAFAGYAQAGPAGGYGSYPTGYAEQPAAQNAASTAGYGSYQSSVDPTAPYASAPPPAGQAAYAQPAPTQPPTGYDHSGSYGTAPATYGKSLSPQPGGYPQYDATGQVIGGHR